MLKKLTLAVAALAVSAACIGTTSASAVTLYKAASKVGGIVPVGETFTAKLPTWNPKDPSTEWIQKNVVPFGPNYCVEASISFKVTQNSLEVFKAVPTAVTFPESWCSPIPQTGIPSSSPMEVSGKSISVGANSDWLGTKLSFRWVLQGGHGEYEGAPFPSATGNPPTKGVYIQEPTAAKAPVSIVLDQAAAGKGTDVTAKFTFTGAAAAWSLQ
jgi:hypothetical protein